MKSVGIKVLKDKLSSYLKLVRQGEVVLVTDRDEVIAEIRQPTPSVLNVGDKFTNFIRSGLTSGEIKGTRPLAESNFDIRKLLPVIESKIDPQKILEESRSD